MSDSIIYKKPDVKIKIEKYDKEKRASDTISPRY